MKPFRVGYCVGEYMSFDVRCVSSPMDLDHGMAIQSSRPFPHLSFALGRFFRLDWALANSPGSVSLVLSSTAKII